MLISRQEEIIAVLWIIATLLAFSNSYTAWGWVFAIKATCDTACAIHCAVKEAHAEKQK